MYKTNLMPTLQEKSASGSVASFNTALAMPLVNGEFSIEAYQEGSGDPSPSNVRNIVGFSALNMGKCGVNLWDEQWELGGFSFSTGMPTGATDRIRNKNLIKVSPQTQYYIKAPVRVAVGYYAKDGSYLGYNDNIQNTINTTKPNTFWIRFFCMVTTYSNNISINSPSTDTDYHAYNGEVKTKQLGETVYGGSYNIDGTKHKTYAKYILDGSIEPAAVNWRPQANSVGCYWNDIFEFNPPESITVAANAMADKLKCVSYNTIYSNDIDSIAFTYPSGVYRLCVRFKDTTLTTKQAVCEYLAQNPITVVYEIEAPIETDIGATEIQTLIGNNNIFCDTGDTSLTYKDLDIAKRGSFREVFKLPS